MLPDERQKQEALAEAVKVHENLTEEGIVSLTADYDRDGDMETKETLIDWVFALACARLDIILNCCGVKRTFTPGAISIVTGEAGEVAYLDQHVISTFDKGGLDSPENFWEKVEGLTLDLLGYNEKGEVMDWSKVENAPLMLLDLFSQHARTLGITADFDCDGSDGETFFTLPDGREFKLSSNSIEEE